MFAQNDQTAEGNGNRNGSQRNHNDRNVLKSRAGTAAILQTAQRRKAGENLIKENQKPNRRNFDKGIKIYKGVKKTAAKAFPKREFNLRHCFHLFLRANILSAHGSC